LDLAGDVDQHGHMYGLPDDVDWVPFEGATLIQVCFGNFRCSWRSNQSTTSAYRSASRPGYTVIAAGGEGGRDHGLLVGAAGLLALLGANVVGAAGTSEGTLVVRFADGRSIEIYEDPVPYESYQLFIGGRDIVV
jgi:hypothetical protein